MNHRTNQHKASSSCLNVLIFDSMESLNFSFDNLGFTDHQEDDDVILSGI
jgi:hypothetical protein